MKTSRTTDPRPSEPPMPDPLAFFLTWTTYGSWLPGDERGWVKKGKGFQIPDPERQKIAREAMTDPTCLLDQPQRLLVERTMIKHCEVRGWDLLAVNCRSNHVHVVVTANLDPEIVRDQFKAWCTRKLKQQQRDRNVKVRERWWTERGSQRYIGDEESLEATVHYVLYGQ